MAFVCKLRTIDINMIAFTLKFTSFSMFLSDVNHILDTFDFCSRIELFKNIFEIYKLVFIVFLLFLRIKNFSTIFEKKKTLKCSSNMQFRALLKSFNAQSHKNICV